jgi:molybdopterin molybdotransferase
VLSVDEHLARVLAAVEVLAPRSVPLAQALDRLLAEDVISDGDLPRFANSSMDGYAVRVADVAGADEQAPVRLTVSADLPAGVGGPALLSPGTAARIMTGAPVPEGTEAVIPVEWTDAGVDQVEIHLPAEPGQYIREAGEDVRAGELVLRRGVRLGPRQVALLAAVGRDQVLVHPQPRVVVLSTGSELVPPGRPLGFGQIHDSNSYGLAAAAVELGASVRQAGPVSDDEDAVLAALYDALDGADLVVTSGGVSAGAYDPVKAVLKRLGTVEFDKVAMQPGMPQGFGTLGDDRHPATPIFTLPGNPVSAMVSFEVFVRPVLRKLSGESTLHRHAVHARAGAGWRSPSGKRQFVRAVLERTSDGGFEVLPVGGQGSHLVADLAEASCLAVVPEDVVQVQPGDELRCLLLDRGRR